LDDISYLCNQGIPDNKHLKHNIMEKLYDYLLHYNPFTGMWNAVPREQYAAYWSNRNVEGVLTSKNVKTLIELIIKGDEFIKTID
jgi:hypothetical protein